MSVYCKWCGAVELPDENGQYSPWEALFECGSILEADANKWVQSEQCKNKEITK
jgi:hypothetical protein